MPELIPKGTTFKWCNRNNPDYCYTLEALEDIKVLKEGDIANEWFFVHCLSCGELAFPYEAMQIAVWENEIK